MEPSCRRIARIHEGASLTLWRALRASDSRSVLLKSSRRSDDDATDAVCNEAELLSSVAGDQIVGLLGIDESDASPRLILDDPGGMPLDDCWAAGKPDMETFLCIAVQAAQVLGKVHSAGIVVGDINLENFLYHPERRQLRLLGLAGAIHGSRARQPFDSPTRLAASLSYVSPEQTGRMNRGVDQRSDFHSLGVMFYVLTTGRLPVRLRRPARDRLRPPGRRSARSDHARRPDSADGRPDHPEADEQDRRGALPVRRRALPRSGALRVGVA